LPAAFRLALLLVCAGCGGPQPGHPFFGGEKPGVQVVAHRGGAGLRPENTLAAFRHAAELGADILEMDLRVAADGVIVVIHDATVERTTDGAGAVATMTLADLKRLDAGYRWSADGGQSYPYRGLGLRVPTLAEVFEQLPAARLVLEMKQQFPQASIAELCGFIRRSGRQNKVLVASFAGEALREFRRDCPEVATSMSSFEARIFVTLFGIYTPPVPALLLPDRLRDVVLVTPELVERAHGHKVKLQVWTVNDEARLRDLVKMGVDGIMTDRPDLLLAIRSNRPSSIHPTR
jgi:glycerophosphoryl diester phosphodiesterase